ncbi:Protein STE50 [Smittium culicis]|uniref:Protein STE50 n=1 Tax=Smittium culicis TaxID=133412 RepID=A0A1R1YT45_9FUNG|nr:Protein STE50 [Smittium culicis]
MVLEHALKKYKIDDDWRNYTLSIRYKSLDGGKSERALGLEDKPLLIFQNLKDKGESPIFVLKRNKSSPTPK